jgi:hypothetical protein
MKHLLILSLLLTSCSSVWHVNRAIKKGYTPEKETITVERLELRTVFDTILGELRTDTIRTTETRTIYQDRPLTRQERKAIQDSIKHVEAVLKRQIQQERQRYRNAEKLARIENKQLKNENQKLIRLGRFQKVVERMRLKKENRSFWWLWFVAGVCVGVFRKKIFALIKTKLLPLLHLRP